MKIIKRILLILLGIVFLLAIPIVTVCQLPIYIITGKSNLEDFVYWCDSICDKIDIK